MQPIYDHMQKYPRFAFKRSDIYIPPDLQKKKSLQTVEWKREI